MVSVIEQPTVKEREVIKNVGRKIKLKNVVEHDLNLCKYGLLDSNDTLSEFHSSIKNNLRVLKQYIPQTFLSEYRNPCWYTNHNYSTSNECTEMPVFSKRQVDTAHSRFITPTNRTHMYCLPTFILAGFPKSATTTLYYLMAQHPQIMTPECKGGHFWSLFLNRNGTTAMKGAQVQWYLRRFDPLAKHLQQSTKVMSSRHITLDASVSTLWRFPRNTLSNNADFCLVPSLVKHILPEVKFLVIMRDPVERLFSDYWYMFSRYTQPSWKPLRVGSDDFYVANAQELFHNSTIKAINSYHSCINKGTSKFECVQNASSSPLRLGIGMYYYHIVMWLTIFSCRNFLFLKMEDLRSSSQLEMRKIWKFLRVKDVSLDTVSKNRNSWIKNPEYKSHFEMLPETRRVLYEFYQPHNELLVQLLSHSKYSWKH